MEWWEIVLIVLAIAAGLAIGGNVILTAFLIALSTIIGTISAIVIGIASVLRRPRRRFKKGGQSNE